MVAVPAAFLPLVLSVAFFVTATHGFTLVAPVRKQRQEGCVTPHNTRQFLQYLAALPTRQFGTSLWFSSRADNTALPHESKISTNNGDSDKPWPDISVHVYDAAFSASACEEIHQLTIGHSIRGNDGSSIFFRPPHNVKPLTPLEHAIDSALTALNDTCRTVEYWSREEYMNIDTHADIDEVELEDDGTLRCPEWAHVLYLDVQEGLRGPTCVFPEKRLGWSLEDKSMRDNVVDLVTVPARQGRILRFPGSAMHAVPQPATRWILSGEEEKELRKKEQEELCEDGWLDEKAEDEIGTDIERSVLLFNTWSDDGPPPRGISQDYATGALPVGIEIDDNTDFVATQVAQCLAEWEDDYGVNAEQIRCKARSDWQEAVLNKGNWCEYANEGKTQETQIRVNLMGKQTRRVHPKETARLVGSIEAFREALTEENRVTRFRFVQEQ